MHIVVMSSPASKSGGGRLKRLPDNLNRAVQALITEEVARREKANRGFWAKLFGKAATDRETVLAELKGVSPLHDDRYFLASMCQDRV